MRHFRDTYGKTKKRGITLLITLLLMSVLLSIGASLASIAVKELKLMGIALESETAFQVANLGLECIYYKDLPLSPDEEGLFYNTAYVDADEDNRLRNVDCQQGSHLRADDSASGTFDEPGRKQEFNFNWEGENKCAKVSIYKFYDSSAAEYLDVDGVRLRSEACPAGVICTVIQSRGYNVACGDIDGDGRVVEREYTLVY